MFSVGTTGASSNAYNGQPLRGPLNIPDSPPRLARRAPRKGHKRETLADIARRVPVEVIRPYFNYPLRKAAEALSISVTTLKRLCRRHGVKRWPHRQLSGLNRAVSHLEAKRQAAQEGAADPVISDQLHQLYSRRDIVIDLAFMSDEEAAARGAEPAKVETLSGSTNVGRQGRLGRGTLDAVKAVADDDLGPDGLNDPYPGANSIGWWNRDHNMTPSMMNSSGSRMSDSDSSLCIGSQTISVATGVERRRRGEGASIGGGDIGDGEGSGGGLGGRLTDPSCQSPRGTDGSQRSSVCGTVGDGSVAGDDVSLASYRTPSSMVRLPGLAQSSAPQGIDGHASWRKLKLPSPGSLLAGIPSSTTAATPRASASASASSNSEPPRRPLSPMTIGPSKVPPPAGGGAKLGPSRLSVLPLHHPSDTIDKQIAELSALNDILFGNDTEDVNALHMNGLLPAGIGQASGVSGGVSLGDLKSGIPIMGSTQRFNAGDGDGTGSGGGRLPSIAGLVAAGAYLNGTTGGEQWRSSRSGSGALLVRGRTGEV